MGLSNNKLVLIYGFNEEEIFNIGEVILANEIAKLKVIDSGMTTMKIGNIIEGLKIPTANKKVSDQKVILFNNLEDEELQKSITTLKPIAKADTIFAVVTATSIEWEFQELLEHLIEERKWVTKRKK
jgi:CRISPR/Cas system-associated endonuclease Cas3-HD